MKTKITDAKCPYCKTEFATSAFGSSWAQCLWGQYSPDSVTHDCPKCGKPSEVSVTQIYRYSARKIKDRSK